MNAKSVEILNAEECEIIVRNTLKLKENESVKITRYELVTGAEELVGFMGEYYKLYLSVEDERTVDGMRKFCYFVKSVPTRNEYHRAECERKRFFHKEFCAYTEILPNLQRYASTKLYPKCYYARKDLLVLEDLAGPPLNYRHLRNSEPYTNKHLKFFLTHLAQLHAASIGWEEKENVNIGRQFKEELFEMLLTTVNEWYIAGAKGIIYLAKKYLQPQTTEMQELINEKLYDVLLDVEKYTKPSLHQRNVLLHRDSWERNIFYRFNDENEPTSCCIVDFQLSRYAPPALDVLYFLYGQTTEEERSQHMHEYLDHYFNELQARFRALALPAETITRADFMEDCRRSQLPALVNMALCKPMTMMPEGLSMKWRAEEQERFDHYMNSDRIEFLERIIKIDDTYLSKIMWPIKALVEHLLKNRDLIE